MAFKDRFNALRQQLGFGGQGSQGNTDGSPVRTDSGEYRGYRPGNTVSQAVVAARPGPEPQPVQAQPTPEQQSEPQQAAQPAAGFGEQPAANSQPMNAGTPGEGFTAHMPWHMVQQMQASMQAEVPQQTGYQQSQPMQQAAFRQQQSGFQQAAQQAQPVYQQPAPQQSAQAPAWGNGRGEHGYNYSQQLQRVQHRRRSTRAEEQERMQQSMLQSQPVQQAQPQGNVSYLNPNHFVDSGTAYSMVMRLAQPLSTARCYRIIEFMRNGETVLVNMELVQDPAEVDRCLDLLYGAAYAMNCVFTRVAARSLYLITPRTVEVLPYASMEGMAQRDAAARWPGSDPSNPQDPAFRRYQAQQQPMQAGQGFEAQRRAVNGGYPPQPAYQQQQSGFAGMYF